ncbi:hypothetical protein D3C79_896960 [compost metagenome]
MLSGAADSPQPGVLDHVGKNGHPQQGRDQNKHFGVGNLDYPAVKTDAEHAIQQRRDPLLPWPLADLRVVLQDQ